MIDQTFSRFKFAISIESNEYNFLEKISNFLEKSLLNYIVISGNGVNGFVVLPYNIVSHIIDSMERSGKSIANVDVRESEARIITSNGEVYQVYVKVERHEGSVVIEGGVINIDSVREGKSEEYTIEEY